MKKNTLETRVGLFVALIAIATILILETLGGLGQFWGGVELQAYFKTVQDLKVGDRVKMAGVEIGRVKEIELATNQVRVIMQLKRHSQVKTDSEASVRFTGLLGQNFVNVSFGSADAPFAADRMVLATAEQPDLSAIMTKLDNAAAGVENLTKSFTGDKIDNLLGPFTDFLKQNSGPLTATIANISNITYQVSSGQGTVGKLIYEDTLHQSALQTLADLRIAVTNVQDTVAQARGIMGDVDEGKGTIGKLLRDDTLYNETTASMTNLKEILQKVNRGEGSAGKLVNDDALYNNAKLTLQKVEKSVESLEDTGPLSVLGIAVGKLF